MLMSLRNKKIAKGKADQNWERKFECCVVMK